MEIGKNFGSDLVNERGTMHTTQCLCADTEKTFSEEIKELVSYRESNYRTRKQVIELLSKRIDCKLRIRRCCQLLLKRVDVQRNIRTVQKQLHIAAEKLSNVPTVTIPNWHNEEGLPLAEIHEELDEDGNIVCKYS